MIVGDVVRWQGPKRGTYGRTVWHYGLVTAITDDNVYAEVEYTHSNPQIGERPERILFLATSKLRECM